VESLIYPGLYRLQDRVLDVLFSFQTSFYLTGGTCLHRFHVEHRFSDDLDLFTSDNNLYREDVRSLINGLRQAGIAFHIEVDTRDFVRMIVEHALKIDLVNDRGYRLGTNLPGPRGIALDTIPNIAANKICAIMGRDEPKDVFDLYSIFTTTQTDWPAVIAAAHKKCAWDMESLEFRLQSFPLNLLDLLPVPDPNFITSMKQNYQDLIDFLVTIP
jgi:predicted nucleotidyltransferase component of viral defense system